MPLQIRRGTEAERENMSQPLAAGELLYVTDDQRLYIGNGATLGGVAVTGYTDEDARDAAAELFTNGSHTGIAFSYNDATDTINATVDFSAINSLVADAFQGSVFADDSTLLVDAVDGTFNLDGTIKGNIVPNTSEAHDIGTPTAKFKDLYLSGNSLFLGDASITASGAAINLPVGSTVGGVEIGLATESIVRDLVGSVFSEDSTVLVDATSNSIIGNTVETSGIRLEGSILSTRGNSLEIQPDLDVFTQIPVNFNILAAGTTSSILDGDYQTIDIRAYRGSIDDPDDIESGDILGTVSLTGFSPTAVSEIGCLIGAQCDPTGTTTPTHIPTKFFILNQPDNSLSSNTPFLTFDSFGRLAVNQENAQATLDINGFAKLAVLTAAPATPANGMVAIADGATWDPAGTGKSVMVVYLASGWRVAATAP